MTTKPLAVVAVGGNALILDDAHTALNDQYDAVCETATHVATMIAAGWNVVLTHGNGPQVGFILRRSEIATGQVPTVPVRYAVADTQGAAVTALFFDKKTGKLSPGCTSGRIAGQSQNWSYLGGIVPISQTGNGGGVYVAEFGAVSGIAMVTISSSSQKCTLREAAGSPVANPNTPGLLSIGTFPPRSF